LIGNILRKWKRTAKSFFTDITALNRKKKELNPTYHELQIWCSDMWALLWQAWMRGYNTHIIEELDFCWATDPIENYTQRYIFHNAGVTENVRNTHFYKADFRTKLPYEESGETLDRNKASYKYFELIKSIGKNSCLYE
jgi:hypothetical protein